MALGERGLQESGNKAKGCKRGSHGYRDARPREEGVRIQATDGEIKNCCSFKARDLLDGVGREGAAR